MATSNLKRITAQTLATWLGGKVPALAGKIHTVAPEPTEKANFPCVVILSREMNYEPMQADEVWWSEEAGDGGDIDDGKLILNVGAFTGVFEIRVYAKSVSERERLEDAVLHALMAEEMRPGVVSLTTPALTVNEYVTLYQAPVAYMLDEVEWREEYAFENRRFSFIDIDVEFPALVVRNAYRIDDLHLAINQDLESDVPLDEIVIDEDGDTEPA